METQKHTQTDFSVNHRCSRIVQTLLLLAVLFIASDIFAQKNVVEFDVYSTSATKATQYLLADDVALRDCAAAQCEQLTTLQIGTKVRLLAKSEYTNTFNGVTSRWYKINIGPDTGWIFGGLIAQKTIASKMNPGVKFLFGEAGVDFKGYKRYQVRAVSQGEELDKIYISSDSLRPEFIGLLDNSDNKYDADVISLCVDNGIGCDPGNSKRFIVFKNNKLMETTSLIALEKIKTDKEYLAFSCELENE